MHEYEKHIGEFIQGPEDVRESFFEKYADRIKNLSVPVNKELLAAIDAYYVYLVNGYEGTFPLKKEKIERKYGEDAVVLFTAFYVHKGYSTDFAVKEVFRNRGI